MSKATPTKPAGAATVFKGHKAEVNAVAVTPDGTRVVSGSDDNTLRLWDLATGKSLATLEGHTLSVRGLTVTPDGSRVISGSNDKTLRVWDLATRKSLATLKGHTHIVCPMAVTPDGSRVVSGSNDTTIRVWDLVTGKSLTTLKGHTSSVRGLAVTPDGSRVVSGSDDSTLRVWDLATGESLATLKGHTADVYGVTVTPDGSRVVSGSTDNTIRVWDLVTGKPLATLKGHVGGVWSLAVTPDGSRVVSGSDDNTLRVWNLATGKSLATLEGHTDVVWSVAVTPDGTQAVSGSGDDTLRIWDLTAFRKASYTNAKVLFVGESGAGKSGLVKRLVHDEPPSGNKSTDAGWATQLALPHTANTKTIDREIWLWDFGGQAAYRLLHQLYMEDTAVAVFVFDAQKRDALEKLAEWDRDITRGAGSKPFKKLLVAGKYDVCPPIMARESIESFARNHGFAAYIETSAETKLGCDQLHKAIVKQIDWKALPATVSTPTFRRLKQAVFTLRDRLTDQPLKNASRQPVVVTFTDLVQLVRQLTKSEPFEESELTTVLRLLQAPGAVWQLVDINRILLQPERISHYASAVVRTIRGRADGMGYIPEDDVLSATNLDYGQLQRLPVSEEMHVLRAMYQVLLKKNICLREPRPKGLCPVLVFPHLFKLEKPKPDKSNPLVTYRFSGMLDETYATLVVRLHHTDLVDKKDLWLDAADFITAGGKTLGLKMIRLGEGRGELTVYADHNVSEDVFVPFVEYVHEHLKSKDREVVRIRHYTCPNPACGQPAGDNRPVEVARMDKRPEIYCSFCQSAILLDDALEKKYQSSETAETVQKMKIQVAEKLDNESKERLLVHHVGLIVAEAGQIFRELPQDHGIDGEIEFKRTNVTKGKATAKKLYLQLKSGDSYLRERKRDDTEIFDIDQEHARYWQDHHYDVWLVIRNSDGTIRWMNATTYLKEHSIGGRDVKQIVFNGEPFTAAALRAMRDKVLGTATARR